MNIDPDLQEYYDDYMDLFLHPGWHRFISDLRSSLASDQMTANQRCDTSEKWFEERGAQHKTLKILNFESMIRNAYDSLSDSENQGDLSDES
jgi:hypothetical protein